MWPDWASRQLEISPWTEMSVKFLARRSRIFPVNSLTVKVLRLGMRLKLSCWVILTNPCSVIRGLWPQWGTARILTGHGCAWSDDEILHSSVRFRICKIAGRSRQGGKNAGRLATQAGTHGRAANSLGIGLSGRSSSQRMLTIHQRLPSYASSKLLMPRAKGASPGAFRDS